MVCLILIGIFGAIGYRFVYNTQKGIDPNSLITEVASRGSFDHIVLEQGEIESSLNTEIICQVQSRGSGGVAILWVIDEGTRVEKGDKLVELDTSQLELNQKEQRIQVITEEARVATAKAQLEQAIIARQEYLEGIFETEKQELVAQQQVAQQDLRKAELAFLSMNRMVSKGLVNPLQQEADAFAVANAKIRLQSIISNLKVLTELTKEKFLVKYDSDIESAKASLSAAESELMEETNELREIEEQIEKCVLYAPAEGVVVHANKFSSRGGNAEFVVEAGATVRERQALIRLPDPSQMQVKCKVNESRITLIREGMPARITVDAIPGLTLNGRVMKVNRYAEPGSWYSSSVKEYATLVEIIDPPENIRTGMSAEAQIFVEQLDDALQVPVQGLYEHGGEMYTLVQRNKEQFETAKVELEATNDTMASISEGLSDGDRVVLNLREHLSLMDLPAVTEDDTSELRKLNREAGVPGGPPAGGRGANPASGRPGFGGSAAGGGKPGAWSGGGKPGGGKASGRPGASGSWSAGGQRGAGGKPGGGRPGPTGRPGSGGPPQSGKPGASGTPYSGRPTGANAVEAPVNAVAKAESTLGNPSALDAPVKAIDAQPSSTN